MPLDLARLLSQLVAIPSVNPMGRPVSGPEFYEYRMTDFLQGFFTELGVPWQRQPIEPLRDNIVARLDGDPADGPILMFEAHQDTVPVDGMTIPPWTPTIEGGRLYGRGSCDIKGGMTAMLGAFERLAREPRRGRPTLVMACSINEELGYSGAADLPKLWSAGAGSILPRRPAAAVVAEPTELDVVVAHKGAVRWRCRTRGRATHSSQPHLGDNALYRMAPVLAAIESYQRDVVPTLPTHPRCGAPSVNAGVISGGISVNTVPDWCMVEIDRRILPGDDGRAARRHVIDYIASYPGVDAAHVEHDESFMLGDTLMDGVNLPLAERLRVVAEQVRGHSELIGVPYGTDASRISAAGAPSVVFGPGSIDQAHTADEWVELAQVEQASETLYRFGREAM